MQVSCAMAYGGRDEQELTDIFDKDDSDINIKAVDATDPSSYSEKADFDSDKNIDELINSTDSLSSSTSISDSDLTSTDSEDSLALSESESITDVTPLNSPYCDSPLPQCKSLEHKSNDDGGKMHQKGEVDKSVDYSRRPETNILIRAIEKLEMETQQRTDTNAISVNVPRKKMSALSSDESKRLEQENQRLFKRAISQQSRIRSLYPMPNQALEKNVESKTHSELGKSDSDISVLPKKSKTAKWSSKEGKCHTLRQQKCLSHPSSYSHTFGYLEKKELAKDETGPKSDAKSKAKSISGKKASIVKEVLPDP